MSPFYWYDWQAVNKQKSLIKCSLTYFKIVNSHEITYFYWKNMSSKQKHGLPPISCTELLSLHKDDIDKYSPADGEKEVYHFNSILYTF